MAKKILIIGGGPAGIMAAIQAAKSKNKIILLEKNSSLGKKLLLTGKGRCNLTNLCDLDSFLKRFSKNGQFLRDAFKEFFNEDLMRFFEERGVKLKTERQQRVFPESDDANTILECLKKEMFKSKLEIIYNSRVEEIILYKDKVKKIKLKNGKFISCDAVIIATGGASYTSTGSEGDGFKIAEFLGHSVMDTRPGLVPLITKEQYPKLLEGLTLKNIQMIFSNGKKKIVSEIGEILFTDFGISGPLVLTLSGKIVDWLSEGKEVYVDIDLKPALSKEKIEVRILKEFKNGPKRTIKNTLKDLMPDRLVGVFLKIADISSEKIVSHITQEERRKIASCLKALRLNIFASRPMNIAMVTRGGISLKEINPRTMESKKIKGLYFAGEIIDIDGDTGGFNLQAAFSTGHLAGKSATRSF